MKRNLLLKERLQGLRKNRGLTLADVEKGTGIPKSSLQRLEVCYNILYKMIQTNLDLNTNFIMDIALGDRSNAKFFFDRLDFKDNKVISFFTVCSDENEWRKRHEERIKNPQPNQVFTSFEHVVEHYKNADFNPFEHEHIIDTAEKIEKCFDDLLKIIDTYKC